MDRKTQTETAQPDINQHDKTQFENMINEGLRCAGLHICASRGFGKSRLLFRMAETIRNLEDTRTIIFDGSDSWLYGFSQIPVFNVCNEDITSTSQKHTLEIEHFNLNNWNLVKLALENHQDLLFRLKTKKPSKRGFFIRTVINYLDDIQREQRELNETHEPKQQLAFFIEEAQDAFNCRSTMRTEAEQFLTTFNEGRNNKEAFFTASQRLSDFSKTLRSKQVYVLGKIAVEDITPQLRRIEKQYNINLTEMPLRTWFYEGETFVSPQWTQHLKPFIVNAEIRKEYSKPSFYKSVPASEKKRTLWQKIFNLNLTPQTNNSNDSEKSNQDSEESELDLTMTDSEDSEDNTCMFPTE